MISLENSFLGTSARSLLSSFISVSISKTGKRTVLIPSFCCEAVYLAAFFAGASIILVDVNLENYSLDLADLQAKINEDTVCVVVPHMFGYSAYTEDLLELYTQHPSIIWIDDACQTYLVSPIHEDLDLYNKLDYRLSSFHSSKPLSGNMALMESFTNNHFKNSIFQDAIHCADYTNKLSVDHEIRRMQSSYFSFIVSSFRLGLGNIRIDEDTLCLFKDAYTKVITPSVECINQSINNYVLSGRDGFEAPHLIMEFIKTIPESTAYRLTVPASEDRLWRLPIVFHDPMHQKDVSFTLRQNNINVSNHYHCLGRVFREPIVDPATPQSSNLSDRVINIWFSTMEEVRNASSILKECSKRFHLFPSGALL
ncbi:DegT/DnrJ/EryC1/StrS family aminotransferase [Synechococcus sp. AH-551-N17]|nr:DegT/DnrJ/EryC1/StrS family aminotransferase [Synechococcus sp. AH-551-N17]